MRCGAKPARALGSRPSLSTSAWRTGPPCTPDLLCPSSLSLPVGPHLLPAIPAQPLPKRRRLRKPHPLAMPALPTRQILVTIPQFSLLLSFLPPPLATRRFALTETGESTGPCKIALGTF